MKIDNTASALYSGVQGLQKAQQGTAEAAQQISRLNSEQDRVNRTDEQQELQAPAPSLTEEAVNLVVNEHLAKASTKVITTADDVMGTLIDTKV
jgi:flagellar hook-associated protein FlgK